MYGPEDKLSTLGQQDALAVASELTDLYSEHYAKEEDMDAPPPQQEIESLRTTVCSYMAGYSPYAIANSLLHTESEVVEVTLTDAAARMRYYNKRLWRETSESLVARDLMYAADRDPLDRLLEKVLDARSDGGDAPPQPTIPMPENVAVNGLRSLADERLLVKILNERIDHKGEAADQALELYEQTPEFKAAFAREGQGPDTEIFVINPGDTSERAAVRRQAAWLMHRSTFMNKDGTTMKSMQEYEVPEQDYHFVAISHTPNGPEIMGSMYLKIQMPDNTLPSLAAIDETWNQSIPDIFEQCGLPDLLNHPRVMDIITVGVRPKYAKSWANAGMYNALGLLADNLGIKYFVTILDEGPAAALNNPVTSFRQYADKRIIRPVTYDAPRGPGANRSLPLFCDIDSWKKDLPKYKKGSYFGDKLLSRFKVTGVWDEHLTVDSGVYQVGLGPQELFQRHDYDRTVEDGPVLYMGLSAVTDNYVEFMRTFPENTAIHYSVEANDDKQLLQHIRKLGGNYEINSYAALVELKHSGLKRKHIAERVIFGNPVKSRMDIANAYAAGVRQFAFESKEELDKLAEYAPGAKVCLRLAMPASPPVADRLKFGMPIETPAKQQDAADLMEYARSLGLDPYGLALGLAPQTEDVEAWDRPLQDVAALMRTLSQKDIQLQMLDIGSGFPAYHKGFLPPMGKLGTAIKKALKPLPYQPEKLVIKPGQVLAGNAGALMTEVIGVSEHNGQGRLSVNVGVYNGLMESLKTGGKLTYPAVDSRDSEALELYTLHGPTNDEQDIIGRLRLSADLQVGDRIILYTTGAYTTLRSPYYNGFKPPKIVYVPGKPRVQEARLPQRLASLLLSRRAA